MSRKRELLAAMRKIHFYCTERKGNCEGCLFAGECSCKLARLPQYWPVPKPWTEQERDLAAVLNVALGGDAILKAEKGMVRFATPFGYCGYSLPVRCFPSIGKNGGKALLSEIARSESD